MRRGNANRGGFSAIAAALLLLTLTACKVESGSGTVVTRRIDTDRFSKLEVKDAFTVNVTADGAGDVTVRIDDDLVDALDVGVSNGTLRIGLLSGADAVDTTLEADVSVTSLVSLEGSEASTITLADPLATGPLSITLSGASRLTGAIETGQGSVELSGASQAYLSGSATAVDVTESGASLLSAAELTIQVLTIELSGASGATVTVRGSLSAQASDASTLRYAGSPTVERSEASGASNIEALEEAASP